MSSQTWTLKARLARALIVLGVVAAVMFALFLLVAQPGEAPDAGEAYQYAKLQTTLYGKIAALSHYDVLNVIVEVYYTPTADITTDKQ